VNRSWKPSPEPDVQDAPPGQVQACIVYLLLLLAAVAGAAAYVVTRDAGVSAAVASVVLGYLVDAMVVLVLVATARDWLGARLRSGKADTHRP
jgi:hypothetical protein